MRQWQLKGRRVGRVILALGVQSSSQWGRRDSWGSIRGVWPLVSLWASDQSIQPSGRSRASLQTSSCIPGALGPPTITRRFHNLPRKHHYLATEFKRMSLLETVHIQTTAEGHALGETGGSLATDPKKQVGRRTKRKYPSHSRVTTVGNNSLLIL